MSQDGDRWYGSLQLPPIPGTWQWTVEATDARRNVGSAGWQLQGRRQLLLRTIARQGAWMARIVVIGAGVGGLGAALGLADRGHDVLVVERDPPPPTTHGDDAFSEWDRPHVPQFRQAHAFSARSRNLLAKYAPAVLDRLRDDGIEEINFFKMLAPPELHRPEDDEFTGLLSRRPAFELALRLTAAEHPRIEIRCPALITGLLHRDDATGVQIVGVRIDDDLDEPADVVIDAGGRRSPMGPWLHDLGVDVREDVQDCGITYHTRYYRQTSTSTLSRIMLPGVRGELEGVLVIGFIGDHDTYGLLIGRRTLGRGAQGAPARLGVRRRPRRDPVRRAVGGARERDPPPQRRHHGRASERPAALGVRRRAGGARCAPRRRLAVHDEPGLRLGSIDGVDVRVRRRRGDLRGRRSAGRRAALPRRRAQRSRRCVPRVGGDGSHAYATAGTWSRYRSTMPTRPSASR